jgi:hypothetical protein
MDVPAVCKRNELFSVQLETEKGSDLIGGVAETRGGGEGFEPACGPAALLDAPMVLLHMAVHVAVRPARHPVPEDGPNGPRVGVVAIGGDAVGRHPGQRPRRTKEGLGRCELPRVAEASVHEVAISINRAVEIAPLFLHFDVGLVDLPRLPTAPRSSLRKASVRSGAGLTSQPHVALGSGEQVRHLPALAFEGRARGEDFPGDVREHVDMG